MGLSHIYIMILSGMLTCGLSLGRLPARLYNYPDDTVQYYHPKTNPEIKLLCEAKGNPTPQIEWFLDGELIHTSDGSHSECLARGPGNYTCHATNQWGTDVAPTVRILHAELDYHHGPMHVVEREAGESLVLPCEGIYSRPKATISWMTADIDGDYDDNLKKVHTSRRITMDDDGVLYFAYMKKGVDDIYNRKYLCSGRNSMLGINQEVGQTQIIIHEGNNTYRAPTALIPKRDDVTKVVLKGDQARLKCFFAGYPLPHVKWEYYNSRVQLSDSNTLLTIDDVTQEDEGRYGCYGNNDEARSSTLWYNLKVEAKPTFPNGGLRDLNGTVGGTATFHCATEATPTAKVQWFINGHEIYKTSPGPRRAISEDSSTLTFHDLCKDDCPGGQTDLTVVQCRAHNPHGQAYSSAYLNVLDATKIVDKPTSHMLTMDDLDIVVFQCNVTHDPSTDLWITWWHSKMRMYRNSDERILLWDDDRSLGVNLTGLKEERDVSRYIGTYTCNVTNGYSSDSAQVMLAVQGVRPPSQYVDKAEMGMWMIALIGGAAGLLLVIVILGVICGYRRRGPRDKYLVNHNEKMFGNDVEEDIDNEGFQEYIRPKDRSPIYKSRGTLSSLNQTMDSDYSSGPRRHSSIDEEGLTDYSEDASFLHLYIGKY